MEAHVTERDIIHSAVARRTIEQNAILGATAVYLKSGQGYIVTVDAHHGKPGTARDHSGQPWRVAQREVRVADCQPTRIGT